MKILMGPNGWGNLKMRLLLEMASRKGEALEIVPFSDTITGNKTDMIIVDEFTPPKPSRQTSGPSEAKRARQAQIKRGKK